MLLSAHGEAAYEGTEDASAETHQDPARTGQEQFAWQPIGGSALAGAEQVAGQTRNQVDPPLQITQTFRQWRDHATLSALASPIASGSASRVTSMVPPGKRDYARYL